LAPRSGRFEPAVCRVRELRCSFTIATFSRNEIRAASDLAVFCPAIPAKAPLRRDAPAHRLRRRFGGARFRAVRRQL
jgi:hypothetical protein